MIGLYDLTENGKCTGCGACCSSILPMSRKEISKIRGYIKKHHIEVSTTIDDIDCPFMDREKKTERCKIYPVRPGICKAFKCDAKDVERFGQVDGVYNLNQIFGGKSK